MRFIGNCNYSLKSMGFFLYEVAYVLAEIMNIRLINIKSVN